MINKEQTQWQDDGTVLSLPPRAWCRAKCHEPNSTAEYFHQAPPDSPPYTLAGLRVRRHTGPALSSKNHFRRHVFNCCTCNLCSILKDMKAYITSSVLLTLYISAWSPAEGRVTGSTLHLLLLNRNFWLGFSYSINMKKSIFVGMTISQLRFVPLMINCKVLMTEQKQLPVQRGMCRRH